MPSPPPHHSPTFFSIQLEFPNQKKYNTTHIDAIHSTIIVDLVSLFAILTRFSRENESPENKIPINTYVYIYIYTRPSLHCHFIFRNFQRHFLFRERTTPIPFGRLTTHLGKIQKSLCVRQLFSSFLSIYRLLTRQRQTSNTHQHYVYTQTHTHAHIYLHTHTQFS